MRKTRILAFTLVALFVPAVFAAPGTVTWYKFSKKFISDHYASDSAFGMVTAANWSPARSVHSISCGGNDGELHIALPAAGIQTNDGHPTSANVESQDDEPNWGIVAELPNANE